MTSEDRLERIEHQLVLANQALDRIAQQTECSAFQLSSAINRLASAQAQQHQRAMPGDPTTLRDQAELTMDGLS